MSGHQKLDQKETEENNSTPTQSQVSLILLANFVVERVTAAMRKYLHFIYSFITVAPYATMFFRG